MEKNPPPSTDKRDDESEFSASLARLVQLAEEDVATHEAEQAAKAKELESLRASIIVPKKKIKPKAPWYKKYLGTSIKFRLSYYAAGLIVLLVFCGGYFVLPEMMEQMRLDELHMQVQHVPKKKKNKNKVKEEKAYTVVDAATDASGAGKMGGKSLAELAEKQVSVSEIAGALTNVIKQPVKGASLAGDPAKSGASPDGTAEVLVTSDAPADDAASVLALAGSNTDAAQEIGYQEGPLDPALNPLVKDSATTAQEGLVTQSTGVYEVLFEPLDPSEAQSRDELGDLLRFYSLVPPGAPEESLSK